jgi:two-component system, OmpR family, KDP operon response regulator KdpE
MTRILAVDDEPQILRALATNLRARGYTVDLAATGEAALTLAARKHPDLVILDLGLPGIDGVEVIRGLRGWSSVPIIVLSVRETERDKVAALDAGADDYVTKPFGMDELLARLRAALRRAAPGEDEAVVETAHFTVDLAAKRVRTPLGEVRLTPTEWHLVEVLVRNAGKLVTQRQLLQEVWGTAVRDRDELPPRLLRADPPEARAGSVAAALLPHRGADGLSLRGGYVARRRARIAARERCCRRRAGAHDRNRRNLRRGDGSRGFASRAPGRNRSRTVRVGL